ncbi:hypothetical protein AB6870_15750 [Rahnella inusitata]|uniref:hypothetical protein n=1 Tax=Rahnella inusitata TaxID=58169 RepID=UPI0039BE1B24
MATYNEVPVIRTLEDQFLLADDSPSGLRHWAGGWIGPVAGTPCTVFYPYTEYERFDGQHLCPMNYEIHVQTGWDVIDLGFTYDCYAQYEVLPATFVRKYLELVREIELLTAIVLKGRTH